MKNNAGYLLMDALVGVMILGASVIFIIEMYANMQVAQWNAELNILAWNEFEKNFYSGMPNETVDIEGVDVVFAWDSLQNYCMMYTDYMDEEIHECVKNPLKGGPHG
jgi:hypothetical protein